ncbi:replication initiation factor [Acinetobacter sp. WC-743]|nr:replication initiation factor [Acinetobacter sp. WC-743]
MDTADWDLITPFAREFPTPYMHMVSTSSGVKPVQCRLPADNEIAVVDWVNFTFGIETISHNLLDDDECISDEQRWSSAVELFNENLEYIFGFTTTSKNNSGRNFYKESYVLGENMGLLCIGGQRNTILIMINGKGCAFAKEGWERRLYTFLSNYAERAKLTRVDLAHDDFDGTKINVDWGDQQDNLGGFQLGNRAPNVEHKGNWKRPNGKGRTLNIGSRQSGKYLRLYEKGRAEGDPDDNWQRAEVEFKSVDRILPYDILLAPSEYFIASYPCFLFLAEDKQPARIETIVKTAKINAKTAIENLKHQYGKYINIFKQVFEPDELINLISCSDPLAYPKRLDHVLITARRI